MSLLIARVWFSGGEPSGDPTRGGRRGPAVQKGAYAISSASLGGSWCLGDLSVAFGFGLKFGRTVKTGATDHKGRMHPPFVRMGGKLPIKKGDSERGDEHSRKQRGHSHPDETLVQGGVLQPGTRDRPSPSPRPLPLGVSGVAGGCSKTPAGRRKARMWLRGPCSGCHKRRVRNKEAGSCG